MPDQLPVLSRPREGALIAGVCAGLARRVGIQPTVLRILAVVATVIFGGLGATLYLAGVLLLPRDGEPYGPLPKAVPALRRWPAPVLAGVVITLAVAITWISGGVGVIPAVIIAAVLWFGVFAPRRRNSSYTAAEPTPFERAAAAWRVRLGEQEVPGFESAATQPRWQQPYTDPSDRLVLDQAPTPPAVPRRRRDWRLWGLALALIGVGTGTVAALGLFWGLPTQTVGYLGAILAALGITGVVAAKHPRPPLLIPAAVVTAVVTMFALVPVAPNVGAVTRTVTTESELPTEVRLGAGSVDLDLSGLQLTRSRTLTIDVGAGEVVVDLPDQLRSHVQWRMGAGDALVAGKNTEGLNASDAVDIAPAGAPEQPVLTLDIHLSTGDLEVRS